MSIINKRLRLQKNILLATSIAMLVTNSLLALKLYNQEIITRNLPITDQELIISNSYINDAALKLRADQLLSLIFSMKKENASSVSKALMKQVDGEFHESFKVKLEKLKEDIMLRGYRYIFNDIQGYEYDNYNFSVRVKGYLETYLGGKQIANDDKEYLLTFTNKSGIINLKSFEEVKNDK